jgi:DNA-binding beta-propeller fold protein YncE
VEGREEMENLGCPASWAACVPCGSNPVQLCANPLGCQGPSHDFCCASGMIYNPQTGTCSSGTCPSGQILCADGYCCANTSCAGNNGGCCESAGTYPGPDGKCGCALGLSACAAGNCCATGTCPTGTTCPLDTQVIIDGCCVNGCPAGQCKGSGTNCCSSPSSSAGTSCPACPSGQMLNGVGCCGPSCGADLCLGTENTCCPSTSSAAGTVCAACTDGQVLNSDGCCAAPVCTTHICDDGCCNVACQYGNNCCADGQKLVNGQCQCSNGDVCALACVGPIDNNGKQSCCHPGYTHDTTTGTCYCDTKTHNPSCGTDNTCCINGGCCGNTECLPTYQASGVGNVLGYVPVASASANNISVYNMSANTYVSSIEVQGAIKTLIHPTNGNLYVLSPNTYNSLVTVIDSENNNTINTITVAGSAVDMVMDSKGIYLYVLGAPCQSRINISVVDISTSSVTNHPFDKYYNGYAIAISPDDKYLLLSSVNYARDSGNLLIYSLESMPKIPGPPIVLNTDAIVEIVFSADGKTIYALENKAYHPSGFKCSEPLGMSNSQVLVIDFSNPAEAKITGNLSFPTGIMDFASGMAITRDNLFLYVTRQEVEGNGPSTQNQVLYRMDINNPENLVATTYVTGQAGGSLSNYRQRILMSGNGQYLYVPVTNGVYSIDLQDTTAVSLISGTGGVGNLTITSPPGSTLMCCDNQVLDTTLGNCCGSGNVESPCLFTSGTCCASECCESGVCCSDTTQKPSVPTGCILPGNRCCHDGTQVATGACCKGEGADPSCGTEPGGSGSCCCDDNLETAADGLCCNNTWHPTPTDPRPGKCCQTGKSSPAWNWNPLEVGTNVESYTCCNGNAYLTSSGTCCGTLGMNQIWNANNSNGTPSGVCCGTPPAGTTIPPTWIGGGKCCQDSDCKNKNFPSCSTDDHQCYSCCHGTCCEEGVDCPCTSTYILGAGNQGCCGYWGGSGTIPNCVSSC